MPRPPSLDPAVNAGISAPISIVVKLREQYPEGLSALLRPYLLALAEGKTIIIVEADDRA